MKVFVYRISMFGNFRKFVPNSENIISWLQGFKNAGYDFTTSIIQGPETTISVDQRQVHHREADKRIQFMSLEGNLAVRFLGERLDVEFIGGQFENGSQYFREKLLQATKLFEVAHELLENKRGTRLAYFVDILIEEDVNINFSNLYQENNNINLNGYDGEYIEWGHRFNKRVVLNFEDFQEESNAILQLESGAMWFDENPNEIIKGLHVMADINTIGENEADRFDRDVASKYFAEAQNVYLQLYEQILAKKHGTE